jgi:hypothetical protein
VLEHHLMIREALATAQQGTLSPLLRRHPLTSVSLDGRPYHESVERAVILGRLAGPGTGRGSERGRSKRLIRG